MPPGVTIRVLGPDDVGLLADVAGDVFDHHVHPRWSAEFLADSRHHLAVAIDRGTVVAIASAVHYIHPDKPPELWVNEVGVAPTHQRRGLGRAVLQALLSHGKALGCDVAWVLTDPENGAARGLYKALGGEEEPAVMISFRLAGEPDALSR